MGIIGRVFDKKGAALLATGFVVLFVAETRRPLRKRTESRWRRIIQNAVTSIPAFSLLRLFFLPIIVNIAKKNESLRAGLSYRYNAPPFVKTAVTVLVLDYSNYLWHVLLHKIPLLWRFHLVHHTDLDLDVTTALRFHFGEIIGSVFYRGAFVFLTGASPLTVLLYEIAFESATQFHHSNQNIGIKTERMLNKIIVTPRMHGIHHSSRKNETDSNYSVIFSFWDRVNKTVKLDVPQDKITIGVPAYRDPNELTVGQLLKLPFTKIRQWPQENAQHDIVEVLPKNVLAE